MFGQAIRMLRNERGMSLRELADQAGIDFTYLSKIENGSVYPPSESVVQRLARSLGVGSDELLVLAPRVSQAKLWKAARKDPRISYLVERLMAGALDHTQIETIYEIVRSGQGSGDTWIIDRVLELSQRERRESVTDGC